MHNSGTCVWKTRAQWRLPEKKTCFDAGKIGIWHCASVVRTQVQKLCTHLDLILIYILILATYRKFARKINFLALGVYCPTGQSAFRRSRPQLNWVRKSNLRDLPTTNRAKINNTQPHLKARIKIIDQPSRCFLKRFPLIPK